MWAQTKINLTLPLVTLVKTILTNAVGITKWGAGWQLFLNLLMPCLLQCVKNKDGQAFLINFYSDHSTLAQNHLVFFLKNILQPLLRKKKLLCRSVHNLHVQKCQHNDWKLHYFLSKWVNFLKSNCSDLSLTVKMGNTQLNHCGRLYWIFISVKECSCQLLTDN